MLVTLSKSAIRLVRKNVSTWRAVLDQSICDMKSLSKAIITRVMSLSAESTAPVGVFNVDETLRAIVCVVYLVTSELAAITPFVAA